MVGFGRDGDLFGRFLSRVHSIRVRNSHVHFHHGVRHMNRVVTCRVDQALPCRPMSMRAPLTATMRGMPSRRPIMTAVLHTKLPLRRNFVGCFSRTRGTFMSTCHGCVGRSGFSVRVRCVTSPQLSKGVLVLASPVLTANDSVRLTCRTLLAGKRPSRVRVTSIVTDHRTVRRVGGIFPARGAAM